MAAWSSSFASRKPRTAQALKRAIDLMFAAAGLVVLAPLLFVIGLAVSLETPGGATYRQPRCGRNGRLFRIVKFRSMTVGADAEQSGLSHLNGADWPLFKVKGRDPRVTRVGRVLRAWSLDELPQLWNVLKGEMSLVGPRPLVPSEIESLGSAAATRLSLRPGLTGPWQAQGRHELRLWEMIRLDSDYVTNWSLTSDFAIIVRTVGAVVTRRGAY